MDKQLLQTQVALFFNNAFGSLESLALEVKREFGETEAQYLPVPSEAPIEFPLLTLNYKNPDFNITVFKSRLDVIFDGNSNLDSVEKLLKICGNVFNCKLTRVGIVKTYFAEKNASYLKIFLPQDKIERLDVKEVGMNTNIRKVINSYECNSIEKIFPGTISRENVAPRTGLIIQRDCNTHNDPLLPDNLTPSATREIVSALDLEANTFILI